MKGFFTKNWPLFGLVALIFVVGIYMARHASKVVPEPDMGKVVFKEGITLQDIRYSQGDTGQGMKWTLDAKEVSLSKDKSMVLFKNFDLLVEPKDRPKILLKGKSGEYARATGIIMLQGDLRAVSDDGYTFETQHLEIDEKQNILKTQDMVKIVGPFFSILGKGLWVNLEKKTMRILSRVTTKVSEEFLSS